MSTEGNPQIAPEEIDSAKRDLTEEVFNQEYLALFVNWEGSVFRRQRSSHGFIQGPAGNRPSLCHRMRLGPIERFYGLPGGGYQRRGGVAIERSKRVDYT
jgi:hypothetical protein